MLFRLRLKHILFITFTIIASLPVLILAGWVEQSALDKEISSVEDKHLLVAKNLTGDLERYIIDVESSFILIATNLIHDNAIMGVPGYLDSLFLKYIFITDSAGIIRAQVKATAQKTIIEFNAKNLGSVLPLLKQATSKSGQVIYSDLVRENKNETIFYLVKSLQENKFAVGILSTKHILIAQKKVSFGERGHAAVVDRTGRAIAHPIKAWVDSMKDMSFLPPVKKMMTGETGVSKFYTPAMKADMVAGYTVVPRVGWGVMVPQPFSELQKRANDVRIIAFAIAIIGIVISAMFSWYIASMLSDPIQSVVDATKIDEDGGDHDVVSEVRTSWRFIPDELRILLSSFNSMRTKINDLTSGLHSEIDQTHAEITSQNKLLHEQSIKLKETNQQLLKTNTQLEIINCTDSLTSLYNRRHFDETLQKELLHAQRHEQFFSLMMIDLDYFKIINDEHGHAAGDQVLYDTASLIVKNVRRSDVIFRVGGEEFAIICRGTNVDNARILAESLRRTIERQVIDFHGKEICVTASIGVSTFPDNLPKDGMQDDLYKYADAAMYHSKNAGRNKVTHYTDIESTI